MVEVKWTPIIIGLFLAIILALLFGTFISWGDILGYLIATIFVGYSVGGKLQEWSYPRSTCWCGCSYNCAYN